MNFPKSFPPQHQTKHPGFEYEMNPLPIYDNDTYVKQGDLLKDKTAIITGADSGIGRAVAIAFAKQGADIAIVYFNENEDASATQKAVEGYGCKCLLLAGDIGQESFCTDIVSKVLSEYGKIDILINNAAVQYVCQTLPEISNEQFDKTFKTNVYGAFYLTKAVLPHLKSGACIINTTSVVAFHGHDTLIDYSMTKGALTAFTRSLAMSLAKSGSGIRVNAVAPGPIWTPFIPSSMDEQQVSKFGNNTPMGRAGQPIECSGAYVFLASEAASYITGQTIHINGGEIVNA
ncbi:MAG: 3-oxoacyl-(acyl-carrier-protein) reductase [Clostridia bacterium]|jgi:NAD(P)-dependent dehydrogenase (short-subunit alcohol dehydrogenase family)|nr:3-oxoacyl-(acyl-carrier-protein) reductase [Clostridia bacterium]